MSERQAEYDSEENIFRVVKDERYFVASNIPFNDERLSWEARGVMGYLLSKPKGWKTRMNDLIHKGPAGMKFIRRVLAELRKYGYMSRKRKLGEHGKFYWDTKLYESPELNPAETIYPSRIDAQSIDAQSADVLSTDLSFNDNKENSQTEEPTPTTPAARFSEVEIVENIKLLTKLVEDNLPGMIVPMMKEKIIDAAQTYPAWLYKPAFEAAVFKNARNWAYVEVCLKNAAAGKEPPKRTPYTPKKPSTPAQTPAPGFMLNGVWITD